MSISFGKGASSEAYSTEILVTALMIGESLSRLFCSSISGNFFGRRVFNKSIQKLGGLTTFMIRGEWDVTKVPRPEIRFTMLHFSRRSKDRAAVILATPNSRAIIASDANLSPGLISEIRFFSCNAMPSAFCFMILQNRPIFILPVEYSWKNCIASILQNKNSKKNSRTLHVFSEIGRNIAVYVSALN